MNRLRVSRMEVQADVQKERCSLSGESATVSLGTMSDNASTKAMAGSILNAYMPLERSVESTLQNPPHFPHHCLIPVVQTSLWSFRDNSLEVQADVEAKPEKLRHHSGSSSLDEASCSSSTAGLKAVQPEGHASACGIRSGKGKTWKKGGGRSGDGQLAEQRSTNSSEFDSPSLSGSLPSVADSHCSHLSSELSCCEPETPRPPPSSEQHAAAAFNEAAMPQAEHDRLELQLHPGSLARSLSASSPPASPREGSSQMFLHISEEEAVDLASTEPEREEGGAPSQPQCSTRGRCIQTDI